jgi:orotate phosphoribosyltransferase
VDRDELGAALREHAYLEGDFLLRSGRRSRYYLDKYRFETRPELLGPLGELIVRKEAKGYGTANRLEGVFEEGERVCLVEDVVTSAGAAIEAVQALRAAGLVVGTAVCVVDREEGGAHALAEKAVRLQALFRASELLNIPKSAAKPHG